MQPSAYSDLTNVTWLQGFAQISKESNKTFSVFNDENAVSKSAKKSDNLTDRDSQTDITGDYGKTRGFFRHFFCEHYLPLAENLS